MQRDRALDWRTGAEVQEQTCFDESIDIHHVFPRAWCERHGIGCRLYNSIVNKAVLSAPTNRSLGSDAPSAYLKRLQDQQTLGPEQIDTLLQAHFIDPARLRADDLIGMMVARAAALATEIAEATGRPVTGALFADIFGRKTTTDDTADDMAA